MFECMDRFPDLILVNVQNVQNVYIFNIVLRILPEKKLKSFGSLSMFSQQSSTYSFSNVI